MPNRKIQGKDDMLGLAWLGLAWLGAVWFVSSLLDPASPHTARMTVKLCGI